MTCCSIRVRQTNLGHYTARIWRSQSILLTSCYLERRARIRCRLPILCSHQPPRSRTRLVVASKYTAVPLFNTRNSSNTETPLPPTKTHRPGTFEMYHMYPLLLQGSVCMFCFHHALARFGMILGLRMQVADAVGESLDPVVILG